MVGIGFEDCAFLFDLDLYSSLDSAMLLVHVGVGAVEGSSYISNGYTMALASTAPVAPATALSHGASSPALAITGGIDLPVHLSVFRP
jgi:hypothetical protein